MSEMCHCGQPLHYTVPAYEKYVRDMISRLGEFTKVTVGDKTYKVPRHYIALHGLNGGNIHTLGFEVEPAGHNGNS